MIEINYIEKDGLLYPDLQLPKPFTLSRFDCPRKEYLKRHYSIEYTKILFLKITWLQIRLILLYGRLLSLKVYNYSDWQPFVELEEIANSKGIDFYFNESESIIDLPTLC